MPTAPDILQSKTQIPSELRTAEWDRVPVWIRERAFFMAGVQRAEVLDAFYRAAQEIADGKLSLAEARQALREQLEELKYAPMPGQEGTIKDLRTMQRMNVALETTVALVRGYSRWMRQQKALTGFPAQRLVRWRDAKVPRDWDMRWDEAIGATTTEGVTGVEEKVALVNHPIWVALSRFDLPYPPFDFGSGMGVEPVDWETAKALGILPRKQSPSPASAEAADEGDAELEEMLEPQHRSLNETLESKPNVQSQELRDALGDTLQGFAEWVDDALVFTDPNGTRPYSAEDLADVITSPLPEGFPALQYDAIDAWATQPSQITYRPGTNLAEDLLRVIHRTEPMAAQQTVWRGEGFATPQQLMARLNEFADDNGALNRAIAMSFSKEQSVAASMAELAGPHQLVIECKSPVSCRDIAPSVAKIQPDFAGEAEVLAPAGVRFRLLEEPQITRTPQGIVWKITVEEVRQ